MALDSRALERRGNNGMAREMSDSGEMAKWRRNKQSIIGGVAEIISRRHQ